MLRNIDLHQIEQLFLQPVFASNFSSGFELIDQIGIDDGGEARFDQRTVAKQSGGMSDAAVFAVKRQRLDFRLIAEFKDGNAFMAGLDFYQHALQEQRGKFRFILFNRPFAQQEIMAFRTYQRLGLQAEILIDFQVFLRIRIPSVNCQFVIILCGAEFGNNSVKAVIGRPVADSAQP